MVGIGAGKARRGKWEGGRQGRGEEGHSRNLVGVALTDGLGGEEEGVSLDGRSAPRGTKDCASGEGQRQAYVELGSGDRLAVGLRHGGGGKRRGASGGEERRGEERVEGVV